MLSSNFNASTFRYLNPELVVSAGLITNQHVQLYASSNDISTYLYDTRGVPFDFDAHTFITSSKGFTNISPLNKNIYQSMLIEGQVHSTLQQRLTTVNSIGCKVTYVSENVLQVVASDVSLELNSNLIQVGDIVEYTSHKINHTSSVLEITNMPPYLVTIRSNPDSTRYIGKSYTLIGIQVYDVERLAVINYLRLKATNSNTQPIYSFYQDTVFNPKLYKLLYPETSIFSDAAAYKNYLLYQSNNQKRIGKVSDIAYSSNVSTQLDNLDINYNIRIPNSTGTFTFGNTTVYGISSNDIIKAIDLYPSLATPKLVTEYAIKSYIDRPYLTTATFCNTEVKGQAVFQGYTTFNSDIDVKGLASLNNVNVTGNVEFGANLQVKSNINVGNSVSVSNIIITKDLQVSNMSQLCNVNVTETLTHFGSGHYYGHVNMYGTLQTSNVQSCGVIQQNGVSYFNSNVITAGNSLFSGVVSTTNDVKLYSNVYALGHTELNDTVFKTQATHLGLTVFCNDVRAIDCSVVLDELIVVKSAVFEQKASCKMLEVENLVASNSIINYGTFNSTTVFNDTVCNQGVMVQNNTLLVNSNAVFNAPIVINAPLTVQSTDNIIHNTTMSNIVCQGTISMKSDVHMSNNLGVKGNVITLRYGIGPAL
jgi:hypothetical protein